ncbi:hypothetical protein LLG90_20400 [Aromatoleum toluclasticum]|uniref:hypothetical protein n=1 Tax=Aromatoleum toluclasticum TaxID=92003 RepID=UPI001D1881C6|nr:hypothetical protein [Aromatoleum toluclasticum]MCC4117726.1 hypothetical protein [Aromatoleum toluclasticum]
MKTVSARGLFTACAIAAAALAGVPQAFAADAHNHGTHSPALKLNAGSKWQTDAPLREGMAKIRANVEPKLDAIHTGRLTTAQYEAMGKAVDEQLAYIVGNCKLAPAADAVLHNVIAEMADGAGVVAGKQAVDDRSKGVVHIVNALNNYGQYFDHPGWKPVQAGH